MDDSLRSVKYFAELDVAGQALDYTTTSDASVPICSFEFLSAISGFPGLTAFPVTIEGLRNLATSYHILHFWDEVDCVDEEKSNFEKFTFDDPVRPDLAGRYRAFFKLVIDARRAEDKHIFRIARSGVEVIVSDAVKSCLDDRGLRGLVFEPVECS